MKNDTSLKIRNNLQENIIIIHEPECFEFTLPPNEEILIETEPKAESIQLNIDVDNGEILISVIPNNSLYTIYYNGQDAFEKYL